MVNENLRKIGNEMKNFIIKNGSSILIGTAAFSTVSSVVFAIKSTPKALKIIAKEEEKKEDKLTKKEIVKVCWRCYIPTIVSSVTAITCMIGSENINRKRNAALLTACKFTEVAFNEYKSKVVETIGKEKEKEIKRKVNEDRIKKSNTNIIVSGEEQRYFDEFSGRPFKCTPNDLERIVLFLDRQMKYNDYVSLNAWYDEIGLDGIPIGNEIGWNIYNSEFDIDTEAMIDDNDGRSYIVVSFATKPYSNYNMYNV